MQKKFWSALLSMVMIITTFSGVVSAKGFGAPSYQLTAPTSVNIEFDDAVRSAVVWAPNTSYTLSGRLAVQGTENGNGTNRPSDHTQYMSSALVAELFEKITGRKATTDADKTLVIALLNDPTAEGQGEDRESQTEAVWKAAVKRASQYAVSRYYASSAPSNTASTGSNAILMNYLGYAGTILSEVDSDGRFNVSFVPEVHTKRYYGFGIKSLRDGDWIPYETSNNTSGSASGSEALAAAETAYNDAKVVYDAYRAKTIDLNNIYDDVVTVKYSDLPATATAWNTTYNELIAAVKTGEEDYNKAADEASRLMAIRNASKDAYEEVAKKIYEAYKDALDALELADSKDELDTLTSELNAFPNPPATEAAYGDYATWLKSTAYVKVQSIVDLTYDPSVDFPLAAQAEKLIEEKNKIDTATGLTYKTIGEAILKVGYDVITVQETLVANSATAAETAEKIAATDQKNYEEARDDAIAKWNLWKDAEKVDFATAKANYDKIVEQRNFFNTQNTTNNSDMTSKYNYWQTLLNSEGTGAITASTPENRLLQGAPIEIRFQYRVRDGAQSFLAGTRSSQTIQGYIVDANGNAPERDFNYEVRLGSATGELVAKGNTNGGYYIFNIPNVELADYILYPTTRYDRKLNRMVNIDITEPSTQFAYTVASGTRAAFYKAALKETTAISGVAYQPIQITDMYTYDDRDSYDARGRTTAGSMSVAGRQNQFLYGVSFVAMVGNQYIAKGHTINNTSQNVLPSVRLESTPYVWDYTAAGYYPPFIVDSEGYLCYNTAASDAPPVFNRVDFCFAGTGTASLRLRTNGRETTSQRPLEGYNSVLTINVESPGIVAHFSGLEMKEINYDSKDQFAIGLKSTSTVNINELRLNRIRYEGKSDDDHYLKKEGKANAVDTTLTYQIVDKDITIYVPWDLILEGGADLQLDLDFLASDKSVIASRTITVKNSLWIAKPSQMTLTVQAANNFNAVVTDRDGIEQNRARLELYDDINAQIGTNRSYNVVGGRYTFENVRPNKGGDITLVVRESGSSNAVKAVAVLQAVGRNDYTATMVAGRENSVVGISTQLSFDAFRANGTAATDLTTVQLLNENGKKATNFANLDRLILNNAGNGRYNINLIGLRPGNFIMRVSTTNMTNYVDIPFMVLPLTIEFVDGFSAITWDTAYARNSDYRNSNKMGFTVKNPLNNNTVPVSIDKDKFELLTEDGEKSELIPTYASILSPLNGRLVLSDKEYSRYLVDNAYDNHEFYVSIVDTRSANTRNVEGDLSLRFYLNVRDGVSTGTTRSVEGFTVPIKKPSITASPNRVNRGSTTSVDLFVKDANGNPVVGVQVTTEAENFAQRTNSEGKTTYLFTPLTTGSSKRFDITAFNEDTTVSTGVTDSGAPIYDIVKADPVFTTVQIINDTTPPTLVLNPYISETTKSAVTISGRIADEGGLSEIIVGDKGRRFNGLTEFDFSYNVGLEYGRNEIFVMVIDMAGNSYDVTLIVQRKEASQIILTAGSTETIGAFGLDVPPLIKNGITFLPIRFVFENILKGKVDFNDATRTITASFMNHTLVMTVGSTRVTFDGEIEELAAAAEIDPVTNRALAPIRTILQRAGVQVDWIAATGQIIITGAGDTDVITYPSAPSTPPPTTPPATLPAPAPTPEVEVEPEVAPE
ncbi:MAG: stalk domain-containing protein [Symbiobacteriaceae bacterium]|nr:stalk domain-containing protein [Symbiobacteriaceae bacterium]